jgi:para-aminobenzoate synthetase/4-amino-4-deoxychorismate lyase
MGTVMAPLAGGMRVFTGPREIVTAYHVEEVWPALLHVAAEVDAGAWAAGFLAYEAAPAFDEALAAHEPSPGLPLLWFGIYEAHHPAPESLAAGDWRVGTWEASVGEADYRAAIARIREHIAAGDTYQVNYTFPLQATFEGGAEDWFHALRAAQRSENAAYIDTGRHVVLSASPELFFALDGDTLTTRPMKGTRPRGRSSEEDLALAAALADSPKDRAENVMIVDLLRNDLGRISPAGAVTVPRLFEVERYDTVWQMTSTVATNTTASVPEIFRALFPCGSVTGAPKIATSRIIRDIEAHPRGVYCGAAGWWGPERQAHFNVAIRTVVIDRETATAHYHVGSGITWDSDPAEEYRECFDKAALLTHRPPEFALLETLLWEEGAYYLLEEHLARLEASAAYFGYPCERARVENALHEAVAQNPARARVRLTLSATGVIEVTLAEAPEPGAPMHAVIAAQPIDRNDVFLYHKTTHRRVYDDARAQHPEVEDVILWNAAGEVTESTIANIVVEIGGIRYTPPVSCGLLPGALRAHLLKTGEIRERVITVDELRHAARAWLINSVRGWCALRWKA